MQAKELVLQIVNSGDETMANIKQDGSIRLRNMSELPVIVKQFDDGKAISEKIKLKLFLAVKRVFDILCAIVGCIATLIAAIFIKIISLLQGDFESIFYIQERIGKDGKTFNLIKFRSMRVNAEDILKELLKKDEKLRDEYEKYHKLDEDPRITKIGKILRKTSLDELPQMLNILKGEMSMIGPRPYIPREIEDMGEYYEIVIRHRPALTGLWQVMGRSATTFQERLRYDSKYHEEFGFKQDVKIFFKTFSTILSSKGQAK